jgi:hypothetical protein
MVPQTLYTDAAARDQVAPRRVDRRPGTPVALAPEDAALYTCGCGKGFVAAVTTSVTCPSCGHGQLW